MARLSIPLGRVAVLGCGICALTTSAHALGGEPVIAPDPPRAESAAALVPGTRYVWIPNTDEGTVSKIDAQTGAEVARYATVTHDPGRVVNHVGRPFPNWSAENFPVATAVDFNDDPWVANRGRNAGTQPSITKIRNDTTACIDRNGNGLIDTSREVNGTPGIQVAHPGEFLAENDECIVMTVVVGAVIAMMSDGLGFAIDAGRRTGNAAADPGNVWVGMQDEQAFYQIDGITGAVLQRVATPGLNPYSAAIDSQGRLWTIHTCCGQVRLSMIDTTLNPAPFVTVAAPNEPASGYGIAVDLKDRVWVGRFVMPPKVSRYDPATDLWAEAEITGAAPGFPAVSVAIDARGNVWAALYSFSDGLVARVDADSITTTGVWQLDGPTGMAAEPLGVGVDRDGDVWTVNRATSNVSRLHIDPVSGQPAPHPGSGNSVDVFAVGPGPNTHHPDFTGLGLRLVTRAKTGLRYFTVPPCRAIDTRATTGPTGGPALVAQQSRTFTLSGQCGIPASALAVSLNIAATRSTAAGHLRLYPAGGAVPAISVINYAAGQTRSNNAVGTLNVAGQFSVFCGQATGTVDAIVDVNGYFQWVRP